MTRAILHTEASGDARRPPALFLHGFMGSRRDWSEVVDKLKHAFFCICVDLPGHGGSVGLRADYTMEGTSTLLAEALDAAGVERTHVVGYSMGGRTALYFAVTHPERCRSLVVESATAGLPAAEERAARRAADETRAVRIEEGDYLEFLEEWYRQPLFETYRRHKGLLDRMIRSRRSNSPRELARVLRGMGTGSQPSLWGRLQELRMPVLAVAGALDEKYVETAERMARAVPEATTAIVEEAGHNVHAEWPDRYADMLIDFLKQSS